MARPAPSTPARGGVRFGTSGWRGVLGDDFTFERARAVCRAVADHVLAGDPDARVVLARDTRFLGERLVDAAARVLAGAGVRTLRARAPLPTPAACHAVRRRRAAAGIVFTASHNPPEYQGIKVVTPRGGPAPLEWTRALEARTEAILRAGPPAEAPVRGAPVDLATPYVEALLARLAFPAGRRPRLGVVYDALHGTGAGVLDVALRQAGARVTLLGAEPDPTFGGGPPDPVPERLDALARALRRGRGLRLGVATDGDADRFAIVDPSGAVLSETDALALLVDRLARTGRLRRGLALSIATGSLPERVARAHGLRVERHAIGFKHMTEALLAGRVDVAGEESGGFAWAPFAHDKDGMLAAGLAAEAVAESGVSPARAVAALRRAHGGGECGRLALPIGGVEGGAEAVERLAALAARPPARLDGARVRAVADEDGLHLALEDGFVLLRASGTEPVLRVYAEAPDRAALRRRLRRGAGLLGRRPGRRARGGPPERD